METKEMTSITTLGELKNSGYVSKTVRDEMRDNLIVRLRNNERVFSGIQGYEESVIPEIQRAILARHNMNLLGLRGQAKTRLARQMTELLDEYIPVLASSDLNEDPLTPLTTKSQAEIAEKGDDTLIRWIHRSERYVEKLATPDVTVADLIGDVDPIKAANLRLDYSDERVIHFGLVPRAHRCIFVINELPDLQPRIQVALFNILQEGDIQIRGFQLRLPLDVQFVFTANPEDYTNRGAIITPLKARIQSQILTHYPRSLDISKTITQQEAKINEAQRDAVQVLPLMEDLVEQVSFEARESEFIDQKSGVSARLTISAFENLVSTAELRGLKNGDANTKVRVADLLGIVPAVTGKVELVYEGEQEGPQGVALHLVGKAIRTRFPQSFPDPELAKRGKIEDPYVKITDWFSVNQVEIMHSDSDIAYQEKLHMIDGLEEVVDRYVPDAGESKLLWMEFLLHGLGEYSLLNKHVLENKVSFSDLFNNLFSPGEED
ncbi:MAG: sigma 54-interacting transcriptional regulator [Flavobacteriales bacterium]|nr:sigma 54-interacting transcriptional regulator [Flavobacteriales bacterium]